MVPEQVWDWHLVRTGVCFSFFVCFLSPLVWFFLWLPEEVLTLLFLLHLWEGRFLYSYERYMFHYLIDKERHFVLLLTTLRGCFENAGCSCNCSCESGAPCCYELHCCTKSQVCISPLALPVHSTCKFVKLVLLVCCHELHWCPKSSFPHLLFLCMLHANLWIWCSLFLAMNFIDVKSAFPHLLFFLCILHANLWIWFFLLPWTSLMCNSFNSLLAFSCGFCMQIWKSAACCYLVAVNYIVGPNQSFPTWCFPVDFFFSFWFYYTQTEGRLLIPRN